jgi:CubicO group peptidase (beta-lactamase class C family)
MTAIRRKIAILLPFLAIACADTGDVGIPERTADGWPTGPPADAGLSGPVLERVASDIEAGVYGNTHALLVEHDGTLVFERYFAGSDERWGTPIAMRQMGRDSLHDVRSVSKSVTSALLGIALGDDFERRVERPVADYLPGVATDEAHRAITLHHVLTMTPGLEWNEMTVPYTDPANDEIRLYDAEDPARHVLSRPLRHDPGTTWYYSGGTTQVLATIVTAITGRRLDEYAREVLFEPLGIVDFEWLGPGGWTPDNPAAMSGLRLRARDLARIGSVYLRGGRWQDRQVVPAEWVELSSTRHVAEIGDWSDGGTWGYGYQWWVGRLESGERVFAGVGNGNQRLFVLPDDDLVVTILAGEYNRFTDASEAILDRVLSARVP